jgi:hypothetical protein
MSFMLDFDMEPEERQFPSKLDPVWSDPEWRKTWLLGIDDAELDKMSPREKGTTLPAYTWDSGYETYGEKALYIIVGSTLAREAKLKGLTKMEQINLGRVVLEWRNSGTAT